MKFNDLKIGTKLGFAAAIVLIILIIIGVVLITRSLNYVKATNMIQFMLEKEVDHFKWTGDVQNLFTQNLKELKTQTDHTKCNFGKWYYNFINSKNFKVLSNDLKEKLLNIKQPHEELHKTAIEIKNNWKQKHEGLQRTLLEKLNDHRKWSEAVIFSLLLRERINVETDPTECAFGQWLGSDECNHYLETWPEFKNIINEVREYHEKLHTSIIDINNEESYPKKISIFQNVTSKELENVVANFKKIITLEDNIVNSGNIALSILNTQTRPVLNDIRNKIDIAITTLDKEKKKALKQMFGPILVFIFMFLLIIIGIVYYALIKVVNPIAKLSKIAIDIADGSLNVENVQIKSKDEIGILASSFNKMSGSLNDALSQVNNSIEQVASGSNQVAQASQSLSQGATEQASSLEEVTSSITEISSQAKQNAENAVQASGLSKQAMKNAENGNNQMLELVVAMADINKSADEVKRIIKVIDDIAFQTNLLALNANVEAARAGKYGKGFAVVAEEVRNLASRSAESVQETTTMVEQAINNIKLGNNLVETTSKQLEEIVNSASKSADLVEEIANASKEQTQGLDQINQGLGQIDQVTQSNTANAEESASAAEELASQAQQLRAIVSRFKFSEETKGSLTEKGKITGNLMNKIREEVLRDYKDVSEQERHLDELQDINNAEIKSREHGISYINHEDVKEVDIKGHKPAINPKKIIKLDDEDFSNF